MINIVLTILIQSAFSKTFLYEAGNGVQLAGGLKGTADLNIKFKKSFESTPKIAIGIGELEMNGNHLMSEVINANTEGFTIRVQSDDLNAITYNWMATDNPLVHMEYVKSNQYELTVPILDWQIDTTPIISSFIIGFDFDGEGKKQILQEIPSLEQDDQVKVKVNGGKSYKLCLLLSQFDNSYASGDKGIAVDDQQHPWLSDDKNENTIIQQNFELPSDLIDYVDIMAISGFASESNTIRMSIKEKQLDNNEVELQYGTWDDSKLQQLSFEGMYFGNGEVKYFDQKCAQLYSECNYEGVMTKICNSKEKIEYSGQIKSIHLPKNAIFTLYQNKEFKGQSKRIIESKQCLDEPLYIK